MPGKVLFIVHPLFQDDIHLPLGPAYLAAVLRQAGAEVEVYDMQAHHYTNQQLAEHLDNNEYQMICVGFLAARYVNTIHPLLEVIGEHKKSSLLIVGGHGPSPIPSFILEDNPAVDVTCIGEAEGTIVDLYHNLSLNIIPGIAYRYYDYIIINPGIAYRYYDCITINPRRKPVQDLDSIPFPAWDLFDMEKYTTSLKLWGQGPGEKTLTMITSRGCTNACSFCYRLEKGIRLRSIDSIIYEIKLLMDKYGVTGYFMNDELFAASKGRIFELRKAFKYYNLNIKFSCNARVDHFDYEMAEWLKEMGCTFVNIGFESTDQNVLNLMQKHATVEQNHAAAQICKDVGLACGLNMIWNMPGDTIESLQGNVNFIKKYTTYDQLRTIRPVTPYPGSELFNLAVREGKLKGPAEFFDKFHNSDLITVNYMSMPDNKAYQLILDANRELIMDYQQHTDMSFAEAVDLIESFRRLYFEGDISFKGARHYEK